MSMPFVPWTWPKDLTQYPIISFFTNCPFRCQKVKCGPPKENSVEIGIPQDSILGPILFIIYVNDFSSCYSCVFGKRNYRVLVRVSVCVCVCLCVCVCFCTITQKEIDLGTRNRNTLYYMKIARTSSILSFIGSRSRSL